MKNNQISYNYEEKVIFIKTHKVENRLKAGKFKIFGFGRVGQSEFTSELVYEYIDKFDFSVNSKFDIQGMVASIASSMFLVERYGEGSVMARKNSGRIKIPLKGVENYYPIKFLNTTI